MLGCVFLTRSLFTSCITNSHNFYLAVENIEDGPIVYTAWNYVLWIVSFLLITWIIVSLLAIYCVLSKRQDRKLKYENEWKAKKALAQVMSHSRKKKTRKMTSHVNNDGSLKLPDAAAGGVAGRSGKSSRRLIKVAQAAAAERRKQEKGEDSLAIINNNHTNHVINTSI